jgi:hypothetical protein
VKCFHCEKAAPQHTLYRVNAKGRPGIWACNEHRIEPDMELDVAVEEIERMRHLHARALRKGATKASADEGGV